MYKTIKMPDNQIGTVKWFNERKGFGFIEREGKEDIFVHYSEIRAEKRVLDEGQRVEFDEKPTSKGVQAGNVKKVEL